MVLKGCVKWAKENNITLITEKEMNIINEQRKQKKAEYMKNNLWILYLIGGIIVVFIGFLILKIKK